MSIDDQDDPKEILPILAGGKDDIGDNGVDYAGHDVHVEWIDVDHDVDVCVVDE